MVSSCPEEGVHHYCNDCLVVKCSTLGDLQEHYLSWCEGVDGSLSLVLVEACSLGHDTWLPVVFS